MNYDEYKPPAVPSGAAAQGAHCPAGTRGGSDPEIFKLSRGHTQYPAGTRRDIIKFKLSLVTVPGAGRDLLGVASYHVLIRSSMARVAKPEISWTRTTVTMTVPRGLGGPGLRAAAAAGPLALRSRWLWPAGPRPRPRPPAPAGENAVAS